MVAGCGINCIKCILFVINFLFFVMGAVGIGVGIWALVDKNNLSDLTSLDVSGGIDYYNAVGLLKSAAIALVVGGAFLFITGFAGCCGAVKEVKCLLGVYIAIVLLVLVAEVVAAGLAIVFKSSIPGKLKIKLYETLQHEYDGLFNSSNPFTRAFDAVQIQFECCGIFNASDFFSSNWFSGGTGNVPVTCCKMTNPDRYFSDGIATLVNRKCTTDPFGPSNPYTNKPCYQALEDWVMKHVNIIIGISFGIAGVEFQCCGVDSWYDYNLTRNWTVRSSALIPLTCCVLDKDAYMTDTFYILQDTNCARNPNSTNSYIDTLAGVVLALCMMTSWKKNESDYFYRESHQLG